MSEAENNTNLFAQFIRAHKYNPSYRRVLSFMAGEASRGMASEMQIEGESSIIIQNLLQAVDKDPKEVLGFQHLRLQLSLLNEWLLVTHNARERRQVLEILEKEFGLEKSLHMWLKKGLYRYRRRNEYAHILHTKLLNLFPEISGVISNYRSKLLSLALNMLKDIDQPVRRAASETLQRLLDTAVEVAEILPPILKALKDRHFAVYSTAVETLPILVEKGVDLKEILSLTLHILKDDNEISYARKAAAEILPTLVGQGADV
ncbi:MAG: hypothetical protein AAFU83_03755, partial [Bacteroidota bacterium]